MHGKLLTTTDEDGAMMDGGNSCETRCQTPKIVQEGQVEHIWSAGVVLDKRATRPAKQGLVKLVWNPR